MFDTYENSLQTGLKLLSDSSEGDLSVAMLISLSRIAVKSRLLTSTQVYIHFFYNVPFRVICLFLLLFSFKAYLCFD